MGKRLKALAALRERWSYRRYTRGRARDQRMTERGAEMIRWSARAGCPRAAAGTSRN